MKNWILLNGTLVNLDQCVMIQRLGNFISIETTGESDITWSFGEDFPSFSADDAFKWLVDKLTN